MKSLAEEIDIVKRRIYLAGGTVRSYIPCVSGRVLVFENKLGEKPKLILTIDPVVGPINGD